MNLLGKRLFATATSLSAPTLFDLGNRGYRSYYLRTWQVLEFFLRAYSVTYPRPGCQT